MDFDKKKLVNRIMTDLGKKEQELVNRITTDFESAYVFFLLEKNFHDSSIVRAAFYTGCENMVKKDPSPDPMVQAAVLEHLAIAKNDALKDYLDSIEFIFAELGRGSSRT